jgi:CrcB protein
VSGVLLWVAVGAVGGIGATARFLVDAATSPRVELFPLGTLVVNVSGAAALGVLVGVALKGDALLVAGTGALGSYTTFSTWMFESHRLGEDGERGLAALNVSVSLAAGIAAAIGGLL